MNRNCVQHPSVWGMLLCEERKRFCFVLFSSCALLLSYIQLVTRLCPCLPEGMTRKQRMREKKSHSCVCYFSFCPSFFVGALFQISCTVCFLSFCPVTFLFVPTPTIEVIPKYAIQVEVPLIFFFFLQISLVRKWINVEHVKKNTHLKYH